MLTRVRTRIKAMEQRYVYISRIVSVLESIKSPGEIAFGGPVSLPLPGLKIGESLIGLPIAESQAKAVIKQCSQAPFGGGEETVVDLSVRKTWQLDPSKFEILNPEWKSGLVDLAAEIKTELGCDENSVIVCQLVKLLLYEARGVFKVGVVISQWVCVTQF